MYPEVAGDYYTRVGTDYALAHAKGFDGIKDIDNVVRGLESRGFGESDIEKFLGGNFARVIKQVWK
ncbi:Membrane dipeptidase [compost metagenome]